MIGSALLRARQVESTVGVLRLLTVLSLIGPAAVLTFVTLQSRTLLLDNAKSRTARMAEMLAQHGAATFDANNLTISRIDEHLQHSGDEVQERNLHEYLAGIDQEMKSVDGIALVDGTAMPVAHSRYFPAPRTYVGDREYIRNLQLDAVEKPADRERILLTRGKEGLFIGAPIKGRLDGRIALVTSRALAEREGRMKGALVMALAQDRFLDFYKTLALEDSDRVALLRADATVLAQIPAAPGRPAIDPDSAQGPDFVKRAAADPGMARRLSEGTVDYVSPADGIRRIASFRKVEGYPVFVEVGFGVDAALQPWRWQILTHLALAALATLVLFSLVRLALFRATAEARMQRLVLAETRQRAETEAALRQSQKMEALGQLTGGIAHDFNNVLNVVLINLELAAKRLQDARRADPPPAEPSKLGGYIRNAIQGAERGVALTHRLLAFAHPQDCNPSLIRLSELVFGILELLGQAAGSPVRITIDVPRALPPVRADANELETALLNLIVNAREAMPEGGRVHIAAREETFGTGSLARRFVVLSMKDTGRGMDVATRARAVEPFFTTKKGGRGSGLGLAIVNRFATRLGGSLRIDSRPGEGTTVEIRLPAA